MPTIDKTWFKYKIDLRDNLSETKKRLPSQEAKSAIDDKKGIYIITSCEPFSILYPKAASNILYIGSGAIWNRIDQGHKKWLSALNSSLGMDFYISYSLPRVQKKPNAYKAVEGDLIRIFEEKFGSIPTMNSQQAFQSEHYEYSDAYKSDIDGILGEGYKCSVNLFKGQLFRNIDLTKI